MICPVIGCGYQQLFNSLEALGAMCSFCYGELTATGGSGMLLPSGLGILSLVSAHLLTFLLCFGYQTVFVPLMGLMPSWK